jgi:hypothetical protein
MNCPKCNAENDDSALICKNCGFTIIQNTPTKPKLSRLAIISHVLAILSVPLTILTGIPAIICSIISISKIRKSNGLLRGKRLAIAALIISLITTFIWLPFYIIWSLDAPPIWYDYTIDSLRSAPAEYNESYQLLRSFEKANYLEDPLEPNGISNQERNKNREIFSKGTFQEIRELILSKSEKIEDSWTKAQKSREIIKQLNSYPEIADLSEPSLETLSPYLANLRRLVMIYKPYILLQTERGNSEYAVQKLIEFDTVIRKTSMNARGLISKLFCIAVLALDVKTANDIANNPKASLESIELLANHYKSFDYETVSLKNCFMNEYLIFKNTVDTIYNKPTIKPNIILKRNSTLRVYRNYCDSLISSERGGKNELFSVWPKSYPSFMPKVDAAEKDFPLIYKCYNPVGYWFIHILTPAFDKVILLKTRLTIENDMLQIVLNQRLNRPINLKARTYSDEYLIDVNDKKIISPGPDKKNGTDDDITMPIEPNVLNLIKKP